MIERDIDHQHHAMSRKARRHVAKVGLRRAASERGVKKARIRHIEQAAADARLARRRNQERVESQSSNTPNMKVRHRTYIEQQWRCVINSGWEFCFYLRFLRSFFGPHFLSGEDHEPPPCSNESVFKILFYRLEVETLNVQGLLYYFLNFLLFTGATLSSESQDSSSIISMPSSDRKDFLFLFNDLISS
jgi:hypothetical protein